MIEKTFDKLIQWFMSNSVDYEEYNTPFICKICRTHFKVSLTQKEFREVKCPKCGQSSEMRINREWSCYIDIK